MYHVVIMMNATALNKKKSWMKEMYWGFFIQEKKNYCKNICTNQNEINSCKTYFNNILQIKISVIKWFHL